MADFDRINNLEEQLREDRRLAAIRRRKRRMRWSIPLGFLVLALAALLFFYIKTKPGEPQAPPETVPVPDSAVELAFVGDISLNEDMLQFFRSGSDYDFSPCFAGITAQLTAADLTIGNLEGNITDPSAAGDHCYPPSLLRSLYDCGFDILQTANTYSIQNGITGLAKTKTEIQQAGMDALGTFASYEEWEQSGGFLIKEVNGFRIAFLGFTKGVNNLRLPEGEDHSVNLLYLDYDTNYSKLDKTAIREAVERAKLRQPDLIIAMVHWGSEYSQDIAQTQKDAAELMFDSGVDLIVGSHSHYVGPMELKDRRLRGSGGSFIAYSLGDFLSVADTSSALNGCILSVRIERHQNEISIAKVSYTPTYTAVPSQALDIERYEILDSLDAISFFEDGYYDRISSALYDRLTAAVERMKEQTGAPQFQVKK